MASLNQRVCFGVGGRGCSKRMASLERDPHPLCPSCRGHVCTRASPCGVCISWSDQQWAYYESRRAYRRKPKPSGGSIPVPGGVGFVSVVPPAPGTQQLGMVENFPLVRPPGFHIFSSLPSASTSTSPPVWSSIPHLYYGGSLTSLSSHHSLPLVTAAPHLATLPVPPQSAMAFPPSVPTSSVLPSSLPSLQVPPPSLPPSSLPVSVPSFQVPPPALPPSSSLLMLPPPSSSLSSVPPRLAILPPPASTSLSSSSSGIVFSLPPLVQSVPAPVSVPVVPTSSVSSFVPPLPSVPLPSTSSFVVDDSALNYDYVYDDDDDDFAYDYDSLPEVSVYQALPPSGTGSGPPSSASGGFPGFPWPHDPDAAKSQKAAQAITHSISLSQVSRATDGLAAVPSGPSLAPPTAVGGAPTTLVGGAPPSLPGSAQARLSDVIAPPPASVVGGASAESLQAGSVAMATPSVQEFVTAVTQSCQMLDASSSSSVKTKAELKMPPPILLLFCNCAFFLQARGISLLFEEEGRGLFFSS